MRRGREGLVVSVALGAAVFVIGCSSGVGPGTVEVSPAFLDPSGYVPIVVTTTSDGGGGDGFTTDGSPGPSEGNHGYHDPDDDQGDIKNPCVGPSYRPGHDHYHLFVGQTYPFSLHWEPDLQGQQNYGVPPIRWFVRTYDSDGKQHPVDDPSHTYELDANDPKGHEATIKFYKSGWYTLKARVSHDWYDCGKVYLQVDK